MKKKFILTLLKSGHMAILHEWISYIKNSLLSNAMFVHPVMKLRQVGTPLPDGAGA
jgi:hypothetical protein